MKGFLFAGAIAAAAIGFIGYEYVNLPTYQMSQEADEYNSEPGDITVLDLERRAAELEKREMKFAPPVVDQEDPRWVEIHAWNMNIGHWYQEYRDHLLECKRGDERECTRAWGSLDGWEDTISAAPAV